VPNRFTHIFCPLAPFTNINQASVPPLATVPVKSPPVSIISPYSNTLPSYSIAPFNPAPKLLPYTVSHNFLPFASNFLNQASAGEAPEVVIFWYDLSPSTPPWLAPVKKNSPFCPRLTDVR